LIQIKAWGGREEYGELEAGIGKDCEQAEAVPSSIWRHGSSVLLRQAHTQNKEQERGHTRHLRLAYLDARLGKQLVAAVKLRGNKSSDGGSLGFVR
jgi:hypothetical protein